MPAGLHPADSLNHLTPDLGIPGDSFRSGAALDAQIDEMRITRKSLEAQIEESKRAVEQFTAQARASENQGDILRYQKLSIEFREKILKWLNMYFFASRFCGYLYLRVQIDMDEIHSINYRVRYSALPTSSQMDFAVTNSNVSQALRFVNLEIASLFRAVMANKALKKKVYIKDFDRSWIEKQKNELEKIQAEAKIADFEIEKITIISETIATINLLISEIEPDNLSNLSDAPADSNVRITSLEKSGSGYWLWDDAGRTWSIPILEPYILNKIDGADNISYDVDLDGALVYTKDRKICFIAKELEEEDIISLIDTIGPRL